MSVSACPVKGPAVAQLQPSQHRSSFLRVQSANLGSKGFTLNSSQLPLSVHNEHSHNSTPVYSHYRKQNPTIVDAYSLAPSAHLKSSSLSSSSPNGSVVNNEATQLVFQSTNIGVSDQVSENIPHNSSYRTMDYSTLPIPFNATQSYMTREHAHDLKSASSTLTYHETRPDSDYMHVDFNPIVESLNFASAGTSTYEPGPNSSFTTWTTNNASMDVVEGGLKCRLDFRSQLLGNGNSISRLSDDFRSSEQLYGANNTRRPSPQAFGTNPRGLSELDHFHVTGSRMDSGQHCVTQFDMNGYPNVDTRNQQTVGKATTVSNVLVGTTGSGMTTAVCRANTTPMISPRSSVPCQPTSTQTLMVSANENSMLNSAIMTPDSSTTGFALNKFTGSSDDGEVSPAPTTSSGRPQTPGRLRKAAPTLATGRRNLKGEMVDPDEADRRMKRRERNRRSAQKCRERKVQRTQELQAQVEYLQMEINRLTQERDSLRSEARQFVTLLQLHCPGVAIPYMSCLNDNPDTVENNTMELRTPNAMKNTINLRQPPTPSNWKSKSNGKTGPTVDVSQGTTVSSANDSFSPLPTMISLHSHVSPTRSKTVLSFGSSSSSSSGSTADRTDGTERLNPTATITALPSGAEAGYRVTVDSNVTPIIRCTSNASVQGPASSSSSSSCSAYELSFANLETSIRTPLLSAPYDEQSGRDSNRCSNSDQSNTFQMPQSTASSSTTPVAITENVESARVKCEEWDPCFMEPVNSIQPDKVDSLSPISPCSQSDKILFANPMETDITTGHCGPRRDGSNTPNGSGPDGVRY
ncbi:unnamed protein product [Fasciola hepatica]|uniref:Uncharacterized protein n=2 Tax=Fasciola hepatica TaxID=6192 RepID=A0ABC9HHD2_FASHE|nr:Basic leucine zipper bZIP transcription factor [Fasciola hepatica]CAK6928989.1 unnamed protein product [Fasciola hepatica]